jgi:DNA-directed RNA polymerase subunit K/omega
MPLKPIEIKEIEKHAESIYEAIIVAAKKARKINAEMRETFNKRLSELPPQVQLDDAEEVENPDQIRISKELEAQGKPTEQALAALLKGEIVYRYKS